MYIHYPRADKNTPKRLVSKMQVVKIQINAEILRRDFVSRRRSVEFLAGSSGRFRTKKPVILNLISFFCFTFSSSRGQGACKLSNYLYFVRDDSVKFSNC